MRNFAYTSQVPTEAYFTEERWNPGFLVNLVPHYVKLGWALLKTLIKEIKPGFAKLPLNSNGGLAELKFNFF